MELYQLQMFQTIVECGSMAKAATRLHCVPSNITARIKQLEEELKTPLFHREGKTLQLTASGEIFLKHCQNILTLCDEAKRSIHPDAPPSGILRIGAIELCAITRLPKLLAQFHQYYPQVSVQITTGTWKQLLLDVSQHKLDGAIVAGSVDFPLLDQFKMYQENMLLITPLSMPDLTTQKDLIGKEIFMWTEDCPYRAALEAWLKLKNIVLPITSITSYATIIGCVSAGSGISLVPQIFYKQYQAISAIKAYRFEELFPIPSHFFWHKQLQYHKARNAFIELIQSAFKDGL